MEVEKSMILKKERTKFKNLLQNNTIKKILVIAILLVLAYTTFFCIKLNEAKNYYMRGEYIKSGSSCEYLIPIFCPEVKKYKIASVLGSYYESYMFTMDNEGAESLEAISKEIYYLTFGLYDCKRQNRNNYSKIEVETINYFEELYYELLKKFDISNKKADEIVSLYNGSNVHVDEMKTISNKYASDYIDNKKKAEQKVYQQEREKLKKSIPKVGMTSYEVRQTKWGNPDKINKDTYSWGTTEQWVYKKYGYVYLKNGTVTSVSER